MGPAWDFSFSLALTLSLLTLLEHKNLTALPLGSKSNSSVIHSDEEDLSLSSGLLHMPSCYMGPNLGLPLFFASPTSAHVYLLQATIHLTLFTTCHSDHDFTPFHYGSQRCFPLVIWPSCSSEPAKSLFPATHMTGLKIPNVP